MRIIKGTVQEIVITMAIAPPARDVLNLELVVRFGETGKNRLCWN